MCRHLSQRKGRKGKEGLADEEKNVFLLDTIEMQKSLKKYLDSQAMKNSRNHKRREELRGIVHKLEMMRREMVDKDTQA